MATATLTTPQRQRLLETIRQVIRPADAEAGDPELRRWGALPTIEHHLEALAQIARRVRIGHVETYLAEVLENVCSSCPQQRDAGYCPLRHIDACLLYRCCVPIIDAIMRQQLQDDQTIAVPT